jgi:diguanylate cyclase (GGDEF)-like protein
MAGEVFRSFCTPDHQNGIAVRRDDRSAAGRPAVSAPEARAGEAGGDNQRPTVDPVAILASIGEVPYEWQIGTDLLLWGGNVADVLGIRDRRAATTGRAYAQFFMPDNPVTRYDAVMQSGRQDDGRGVPYQLQYALRTASGAPLWVEDTGRWFAGPDGRPQRAHGVVRAANERHAEEQRLAFLSAHDELTGEMNRAHVTDALAKAIDEAQRLRSSCALMLVNIDNLARINEAYGFAAADEVIANVGKRLRARLRGGDTIGRLSGNKFAVMLKTCTAEEMPVAAERLMASVRDEVIVTSIGAIAATVTVAGLVIPRHARDVQEALARTQETLQAAKAKRLGSFLAYRPSIERETQRLENIRATDEIVVALNNRRVLLGFEPVVGTRTRQPMFHECLMRLERADGTMAAADTVVPVAERLGLVRLLDRRMLELVMAELIAYPLLRLSLNVSPASTVDPDWWASLDAQLRAHPGVGERLTLEITETTQIHDIDETRGFVARAKDLGCRIAIDDFGAGFTSFRNLRKLGVDIIKIDGAFVHDVTRSSDDAIFVRTLIDLGHALGLVTVAEWVQTEEVAAKLKEWGCDALQGSLIGLATTERPWDGGAAPGPTRASA